PGGALPAHAQDGLRGRRQVSGREGSVKMTTAKLPAPFAALEPFVDGWALATETERYTKRLTTPMPQIQAFYDAIFPRAAEALDYLDQYSLDNLPDDALNLL